MNMINKLNVKVSAMCSKNWLSRIDLFASIHIPFCVLLEILFPLLLENEVTYHTTDTRNAVFPPLTT